MSNRRVPFVKITLVLAIIAAAAVFAIRWARPVANVVKVVAGKAVDQVPGNVTVRAEYSMDLKSEVGGRVVKTALDEGKVVKDGDFLVQLDPTNTQLEVEDIQNNLKAAQARLTIGSLTATDLENARSDLKNAETQHRLGSMSNADFEKQQRAVAQLEKRVQLEDVVNKQAVDTLATQLKTKQRQLENMHMTALFDGKISTVLAHKGDLIGPNVPVATIISTSRTVEARISEENFSGIKVGLRARVRFLGYGSDFYDATVVKVLPTADPDTQRYVVYLDVKIAQDLLIPGITGEASIVVGERDAKALIPRRALFQHFVYVVKDGVIERRPVELGYVSLNQVEILSGLEAGELVIVEDLDRFRPGDHVTPKLGK